MAASLAIHDWLLPYASLLAERDAGSIDLLVIHCTELPDLAMAREYGERVLHASGTGNSGHYYIDRDGALHRFIGDDRVAHHTRGYNERSLGIELVNRGRYPDWLQASAQSMTETYPEAQVEALIALLTHLSGRMPALRYVAGHEDLDLERVPATDDPTRTVRRKLDPGPLFPWPRVLAATPLQRFVPPASRGRL